ncbi:MAG: 7-cyano-7-deazaguanine synthase, partial [Bdellovibrionales bacterium]|nr:7-cyano-7-deazaguanine synthase [Bdellovibrionales bacterium]
MENRVIVLVSGGMDSLVTAAIAAQESSTLAFLHLNYGQRTEGRELQAFNLIADHYQVESDFRKVIDLTFLQ